LAASPGDPAFLQFRLRASRESPFMPAWLKIAIGIALGASLIGVAGLQGASKKLGPLVQAHGTTYYGSDGPERAPLICKPKSEILAAIDRVHAKFDHLDGGALQSFEDRARDMKGLPPLNADEVYVITEDDQLRDGEMVLFIGLKDACVTTVFGFPASIYHEISERAARA
jgi:hypothetical protein